MQIPPNCRVLSDDEAEGECGAEATHMCMCCAEPTCPEHLPRNNRCPYGGMGFIEIEL